MPGEPMELIPAGPTFTSSISKLPDWPAVDRQRYEASLVPAREPLLCRDGRRPLSPSTLKTDRDGYGSWLNYLQQHGVLNASTTPEQRVSAARIKSYVQTLQAVGVSSKSIAMYLSGTYRTLKRLCPDTDWKWLCAMVEAVRAKATPIIDKHGLPHIGELFWYGIELLTAVHETPKFPAHTRAIAYRDGLMVALLACRPFMRLRNLHMLSFGTHLTKEHGRYRLGFLPYQRKGKKTIAAPLPLMLTQVIDRYSEIYRRALVESSGFDPNRMELWVSQDGYVLHPHRISQIISSLTLKKFGRAIPPHLFRNATAASYCHTASEHVLDLPSALDHGGLTMSEKYIWFAGQNLAVRKLDKALLKFEKPC